LNLNCERMMCCLFSLAFLEIAQKKFGMVFGYSEETALIKNLIRGIQNHVKYVHLFSSIEEKACPFQAFQHLRGCNMES
jgi:hypothetical protein